MDPEPEIPWPRVASFMRQYVHDIRNNLNSLDLETAFLGEIVSEPEGRESILRLRRQLRSLAEQLRSFSRNIQDPKPTVAPISARELFLIWREQHAALTNPPTVNWEDELEDAIVNVDVDMIATVFRELLSNAAAFAHGEPLTAIGRVVNEKAIFELREPKKGDLDTSNWGQPFSTNRRARYGLGLWTARRSMEACGAEFDQAFLPTERLLVTQIRLSKV